jgi:hypothetical protein
MFLRGISGWASLACLALCLLLAPAGHAQTSQGNIVGLVTDASSAVIPRVTVTARNPETGFTYTAVTNEEGLYRIPYVNPAVYDISYEAQGFRKVLRSKFLVRSTETARVDVILEVGSLVESVEVKSEAPLLESETSTVGHLVTGVTINKLPLPQQRAYNVLLYLPGVTSQGGMGHVAGQRARAFNATLDGVSGMEPVRGSLSLDRFMNTVTENMGEVKILTTALPAEYGHSGGGIMNISYKSGTNQLHGLAEERFRYPPATHRMWSDAQPVTAPNRFHLISGSISGPVVFPKIYNGRDKTFFLFGFQRHHEKSSENNDRTVPNPAMFAGDFSFGGVGDPIYDPATLVRLPNGNYSRAQFPGNRIPQSRFDPAVQKFLSFNPWTLENNRHNQTYIDRTGPHNNVSADTKQRSYRTGFDYKIDHSFSDRHKIFGRLSHYRHRAFITRWQINVANSLFDYNATPNPIDQRQMAISDSIMINPTTINEIRLGGSRRLFKILPLTLDQNWAGKMGIANVGPETMPTFLASTGGQLYSQFPGGRQTDATESLSLQENLTLVRGLHAFKTGYEILRTRANSRVTSLPSGAYRFGGTEFPFSPNTGNDFASFLLGGVVRADFTKDLATWLPRWWTHSLYFQDDWKVTPRLTLNLGLRWQYESPFNTKYGQQSQFSPTAIDPLTGRQGAVLHPAGALAGRDLNNFQPRLGMAYNFKKDWVFRAGFAVNTLDLWTNGLQENFDEYLATAVVQPPTGNPDVAFYLSKGPPPSTFNILPNGTAFFLGTNYSGRNASYYDPKMRSPYVMNWNAGFQRQLGSAMIVELTYQGSAGVGLLQRWDINAIPLNIATSLDDLNRIRNAAQNYKPYSQFGSVYHYSNYGHNSFHSGTVKFEKRFSHGLEFNSFYTRSKAIDEASGDGAAGGITFYKRSLEKARSDYDVTNRWITYAIYQLPIGRGRRLLGNSRGVINAILGNWDLNMIQTLENGAPFSFSSTGSSNVYLPGASRPNMAPGKTYKDIKIPWDRRGPCRHSVACALPWADINAFAYPQSFTAGQAGRNIQTGPGILWHEVSGSKEFLIRERVRATVRLDVNNPFKRPYFSNPNSAVNFRNPQAFGKITGVNGMTSGLGAPKFFMEMHIKLSF